MISVEVLSPRCELKRSEPPDVPAGVHAGCETGFQMKQAVYESLHMQDVNEPDRTCPEQSRPAEKEVTETDGRDDKRNLNLVPSHVSRPDHVRTPPFHRGWFPLIQPSQMRPPEAAVPWAGYVIYGVRICMMIAMICDGCSECPHAGQSQCSQKDLPTGDWE